MAAFVKKEKNLVKLQKFSFPQSQKLLAENLLKGRLFNSYSFNFKGRLCNRRTGYCPHPALCPGGEQFLWFLKIDHLRFHRIFLLFDWSNPLFFLDVLIKDDIYS